MKIKEYVQPKNGIKFASTTIDFILYMFVFIILCFLCSTTFLNFFSDYNNNNYIIISNYVSSGLIVYDEDGTSSDRCDTTDENSIIDVLQYYYFNFKTNEDDYSILDIEDEYKIKYEDVVNYKIKVGEELIDYRNYWFNVNVFCLEDIKCLYYSSDDEQTIKDYFEYKDNVNELASINKKYLNNEGKIVELYKSEILDFLNDQLLAAKNELYSSPCLEKYVSANLKSETITTGVFAFIPFILFYVVIPLTNKKRKTLGRLILRISLFDINKDQLKFYKFLLRFVPFIFLLVVNLYINNVFFMLVSFLLLFMVSLSLTLFNKKQRSLYDYLSCSILIDDREKENFIN